MALKLWDTSFFLFPNTSIYFKPWVEIGICHYVKKKKKIFFFFPADSYPLCHQSGRKNGNGMPEKPASCEGNGSRSAAFGWSWEIFSLGMLNIKPSLQMESMEYSGFQQSLSKREFGNVLWSVYLMVIFSEYDGKPNPREPLEFWGLASPRCPHVLQIIFADFCPVTLWWPRAVLRRQNCDSLFSLGPIYWDILEITRHSVCVSWTVLAEGGLVHFSSKWPFFFRGLWIFLIKHSGQFPLGSVAASVLTLESPVEIWMRSMPCKNLSKLLHYLFLFCFKDNTFQTKRWHKGALGCINIESFYFFG